MASKNGKQEISDADTDSDIDVNQKRSNNSNKQQPIKTEPIKPLPLLNTAYNCNNTQQQHRQEKLGRGHKSCKQCKRILGSRAASCHHCGYQYSFKSKESQKSHKVMTNILNNNNPALLNSYQSSKRHLQRDENVVARHSSFLNETEPCLFATIEPKKQQSMTDDDISSYIEETQLLLDCSYEYITKFGNFNSAAKLLNRSFDNLVYLATMCDLSDVNNDCPDLNKFLS